MNWLFGYIVGKQIAQARAQSEAEAVAARVKSAARRAAFDEDMRTRPYSPPTVVTLDTLLKLNDLNRQRVGIVYPDVDKDSASR